MNLRNPLGETPLDLLDAYEPKPVGDPNCLEQLLEHGVAADARVEEHPYIPTLLH